MAFARAGGFKGNMRYNMELFVDGKRVHRGVSSVGDDGFAILAPALSHQAVSALSTGKRLEVVTNLGRFDYDLSGSADAIEAVQKCVQYVNAGAILQ